MKTLLQMAMVLLLIPFARAAGSAEEPIIHTVFRPLSEKPQTEIRVSASDALAYWKRVVPSSLRVLEAVTNEWKGGPVNADALDDADIPAAMTRDQYLRLRRELHEFKRRHAHEFWKPYEGMRITVEGIHYCPCCFYAAIGYCGIGHNGWTLRLDTYIAIGLEMGTVCYTTNGEERSMSCSLLSRPPQPTASAVGKVTGPHTITNQLYGIDSQALAYYTLKYENNAASPHAPEGSARKIDDPRR